MSKIKIELAHVAGVKADFVKGEVKITMQMSLEQGLAIRGDLSQMADTDQPVTVEIKAFQSRLPMLDAGEIRDALKQRGLEPDEVEP